MRFNYIGGQSNSGGNSDLVVGSASGLALPSLAFISNSIVEYSIVEYSDSTLSTVSKSESGFGTINSSNVLTRSEPRTTWDGTSYVQASVSRLTFGTSNVRVYVSPIAEGGPTAFPKRIDLSSNYGVNGYVIGANAFQSTDFPNAAIIQNRQHAVPLKLEAGFPLTQIGVNVLTPASGTQVNCAIASVDPVTGYVGVILAAANNLDSSTSGIKMGDISPRMFPPGWYWQLVNSNGSPGISGADQFVPGPMGAFYGGNRVIRGNHRNRTFSDYVVGQDGMLGLSASYAGQNNVPHPILFMR